MKFPDDLSGVSQVLYAVNLVKFGSFSGCERTPHDVVIGTRHQSLSGIWVHGDHVLGELDASGMSAIGVSARFRQAFYAARFAPLPLRKIAWNLDLAWKDQRGERWLAFAVQRALAAPSSSLSRLVINLFLFGVQCKEVIGRFHDGCSLNHAPSR